MIDKKPLILNMVKNVSARIDEYGNLSFNSEPNELDDDKVEHEELTDFEIREKDMVKHHNLTYNWLQNSDNLSNLHKVVKSDTVKISGGMKSVEITGRNKDMLKLLVEALIEEFQSMTFEEWCEENGEYYEED